MARDEGGGYMARDGIEEHSRRGGAFFEVKHTKAPTRQQTTHLLLLLDKVRNFGWNLKGHFCIDEIVYQGNELVFSQYR